MELYCSEECFLRDVAQHEMKILHEAGVYRHIRFGKPGTRCMSFDLVTWPGYLCFCGDMGEFVFSRTADMFEFFRSSGHKNQPKQALAVNFGYWAEKCLAADKNDGIKEYSADKFRKVIKEILDDDEETTDELREAVAEEVLCVADDGAAAAHEAASDFLWNGKQYFTDFWEYSLDVYTHRFLWCCYALAWGIQAYDIGTTEGSNSASAAGSDAGYEAATIMALRIVEFMQTFNCDAEMVLGHFIGKIGQYERELMEREGIEISI